MPDIRTCRAINSGSQDQKKKKERQKQQQKMKNMKNKQHDSNILIEAHTSIQLTS